MITILIGYNLQIKTIYRWYNVSSTDYIGSKYLGVLRVWKYLATEWNNKNMMKNKQSHVESGIKNETNPILCGNGDAYDVFHRCASPTAHYPTYVVWSFRHGVEFALVVCDLLFEMALLRHNSGRHTEPFIYEKSVYFYKVFRLESPAPL